MQQEAIDFRQLGEHTRDLVIAFDSDFRYTYVNPQVEKLIGVPRETLLGRTIWEVAPHTEGTIYGENYRRALSERSTIEFEAYYPPLKQWNQVRCVPEPNGGVIVFARNLTQERLAAQVRDDAFTSLKASEAQARRAAHVLDSISEAYVTVDRDFRITYVNAEAARINKKPAEEFVGKLHWEEWPAAIGTEFERQFRRAMEERIFVRFVERYYVPGVYDNWLEVAVYPADEEDGGGLYLVYKDVTEQKGLEAEREKLFADSVARAERESFLSEASSVLNASLDYTETLTAIARLLVPRFSDWCVVDIVDAKGVPQRVAVEHADSDKAARGWEIHRLYATQSGDHARDDRGIAGVLRSGKASFVPHVTDEMLVESIADHQRLRLLLEIGIRSIIIVPLAVRDNVFGAFSMIATRESGRVFTEDDLQFAKEIGQRAALAVQNARLFLETRQRAEREALLNEIGAAIRLEKDPDAILRSAVTLLGERMRVDRCYFARYNQARDVVRAWPEWIRPGAGIRSIADRDLAMSAFSVNRDRAYRAGEPQVVDDVLAFSPGDAGALLDVDMRALLRIPIKVGNQMTALCVSMAHEPRAWTEEEARLLENVASLLHAALESALVQLREHKIAEQLQAALFPSAPPPVPGLSLAHFYRPALDEAGVGGDYFEVCDIREGCTALIVADLSGKGLAAASQVATVRNMLRFALYDGPTVSAAIDKLHRTLVNHDLLTGFATLFVGLYDHAERTLTYVNCGQEPSLIWRAASGDVEQLCATGPILGSFIGDGFAERSVTLYEGDVIAIFTDGLTEVGPTRKNLLEVDGVADLLSECCSGPRELLTAQGIIESLVAGVDDFAGGGVGDDIALLVGLVT